MAAILDILKQSFEQNKYTDKIIELQFKKNRHWGANDRRVIAEGSYDMLRWWRRLHYYLNWDWNRAKSEEDYWRLGLLWMKWRGFKAPNWEISEKISINDNFAEKDLIMSDADRFSLPDELFELGQSELGAKWSLYLENLNEQASVFLRTNLLKISPMELQKRLLEEEIEAEIVSGTEALKLLERKNVFITKAFKEGNFEVQDLGSQEISKFVDAKPGERIIDACAGAGGKSLHLASLMKNKGKIISLDIHEWKLKELRKRARRDGVDIIECRPINDLKVIKRLYGKADKLLLDVPCSGLGVLKRNPDTKWKLTHHRITELHKIQEEILNNYSPMVRMGGELIYATCSLLPSENEAAIDRFLLSQSGKWQLLSQKNIEPKSQGSDGFFMAKLLRTTIE